MEKVLDFKMNFTSAFCQNILPLVQNYNIAVTICYWIQANSLFISGVNRFNMLSSPCFKFHLFFIFLPKYFYSIQLWFITKTKNISAESPLLIVVAIYSHTLTHTQKTHTHILCIYAKCSFYLLNKTTKFSFHKETVLICQKR